LCNAAKNDLQRIFTRDRIVACRIKGLAAAARCGTDAGSSLFAAR
jgi:hypothetical protein